MLSDTLLESPNDHIFHMVICEASTASSFIDRGQESGSVQPATYLCSD